MATVKTFVKGLAERAGFVVERIDHRPEAFKMQLRLLAEPVIILDVGANVGQSARRYREFFPTATIHCFEPNADACGQIQGPNVEVHNCAVSDVDGVATFNVAQEGQTSSLLDFAPTASVYMGSGAKTIARSQVKSVTLDAWTRRNGISHVDILKMDVQGAEALALRGACRLLREHRVSLIYCEVLFAAKYNGQAYFSELFDTLRGFGYRLFGLYNLTMGGDLFLGYGDAIFVAPEVVPDRTRFLSI